MRSFALDMLGKLNAIDALPTLMKALRDPNYQITSGAALALAELSFKDSRQQAQFEAELVLLVGSAEPEVRASVIWLLGERRIRESIPALIAQLDDQSATMVEGMRMCDLAARALSRMPSPEALSAVQMWRQAQGQPS